MQNSPTQLYAALNAQGWLLEAVIHGQPDHVTRRAMMTEKLERLFRKLCNKFEPELILEIGAHEASFSIAMKNLTPTARIMAFEANPNVFEEHRHNVYTSGVEYLHCAVSDKCEEITLKVPRKRDSHRDISKMGSLLNDSLSTDCSEYAVQARELDSILGDDVNKPKIMWIDVEGAVGNVLGGAKKSLESCLAIYVEVESFPRWPGQMLDKDVVERLATFGLVPLLRDVQRRGWQYNILFVHQGLVPKLATEELWTGTTLTTKVA